MKQRLILSLLFAALAACASTPEDEPIRPAVELYRDAHESMQYGNYQRAETLYKQIMSRYPFTDFAVQAHLDILYVFLQLDRAESLAEEAERFIRENPRHPKLDYVYYMRGLGYYHRFPNLVEDVIDIDLAKRDVEDAQTAFRYFSQLVNRFPDSQYAADARLRMIELKNRIARHEIHIAEFYLRRGAWISAIQRAKRVLTEMQGAAAEIDALIVLARSYEALGLEDLAATARRILAANPDREPVLLERVTSDK